MTPHLLDSRPHIYPILRLRQQPSVRKHFFFLARFNREQGGLERLDLSSTTRLAAERLSGTIATRCEHLVLRQAQDAELVESSAA